MSNNKTDSMYVDYPKLKSYNKSIYMLTGPREVGKTYGWKLHVALRDFVKKGYKFIFARRFKSQTKLEKDWWGSIGSTYERYYGEKVELTQEGMHLFVNGEHAGRIIALSEAVNLKSQEWVNYRNFAFDEFIELNNYDYIDSNGLDEPENYFWKVIGSIFRYVPPELAEKLEQYNAVASDGGVDTSSLPKDLEAEYVKYLNTQKIYMFANAERLANPYFISFGILDAMAQGQRKYVDDGLYVELLEKSEFKKSLDEYSPIKRMMKKSSYSKIFDTVEFPDEGDINIKPEIDTRTWGIYKFGIIYKSVKYYVFVNRAGQYYITANGNPNAGKFYSLDMSDFGDKNIKQIDKQRQQQMINIVNMNRVSYSDIGTREVMLQLFGNRVV